MASKHQLIQNKVIQDWTAQRRGRLYNCPQGLFVPWADKDKTDPVPKWIGPLSRKFKGFPDCFGFELVDELPIFCTVEVKTIKDPIRPAQKKVMTALKSFGVRCYIAKETEAGAPEYELKEFEG